MIQTIFIKVLGRNYSRYILEISDALQRMADLKTTMSSISAAVYSDDIVTGNSRVCDYQFIADSNLMKCLAASSLVYSDGFKDRLHLDEYVISHPCLTFPELSRDKDDLPKGKVLDAKTWNNYWKDLFNSAEITKPFAPIEKKHILLADLKSLYDASGKNHDLKAGVIPFELGCLLGYNSEIASIISPSIVNSDDYNLETWILEGLK